MPRSPLFTRLPFSAAPCSCGGDAWIQVRTYRLCVRCGKWQAAIAPRTHGVADHDAAFREIGSLPAEVSRRLFSLLDLCSKGPLFPYSLPPK